MNLTKEQIAAIQFLDELLHPSVLASIVHTGSRSGWIEVNAHMSELLKLLPEKPKPSS